MPQLIKDSVVLGIVVATAALAIALLMNKRSKTTQKASSAPGDKGDKRPSLPLPEKVLSALEKSGFKKEVRAQLLMVLTKKQIETEAVLQNMRGAHELLAELKEGHYEGAEGLFLHQKNNSGKKKAALGAYYLGNLKCLKLAFEEAAACYKEAVALRPEHPVYLNEAGLVNHTMGNHAAGAAYFEKALSIWQKRNKNKPHPQTASVLNNLAIVYKSMGERQKAIGCAEQAYQMYARALGKNHPNTSRTRKYLENLQQEDPPQAAP